MARRRRNRYLASILRAAAAFSYGPPAPPIPPCEGLGAADKLRTMHVYRARLPESGPRHVHEFKAVDEYAGLCIWCGLLCARKMRPPGVV